MLGRSLVSFLARKHRRRAPAAAGAAAAVASSSSAPNSAAAKKKRSRWEYEEEEEEEGGGWAMVEEHVPFRVRPQTPYIPEPEPIEAAKEGSSSSDDAAELAFEQKVQEITTTMQQHQASSEEIWGAAAVAEKDHIVLAPLLKRHKPAAGKDDDVLYLGPSLSAIAAAGAGAAGSEVYVSFDDIFSDAQKGKGEAAAAAAAAAAAGEGDKQEEEEEEAESPLFPRTASRTDDLKQQQAAAVEAPDEEGEEEEKGCRGLLTGQQWSDVWATVAASGLPEPSVFTFRATVGFKALAAPSHFPSWAAGTQAEQDGGDEDLDHIFGRPAPPPLRPRDPSEPSIWERSEALVDCCVSVGPGGCRVRAGGCARTGVSLFGLEGTDLSWDPSELHSVTLYQGLPCLGGGSGSGSCILSVTRPSLRPPWASPRLDVIALAVDADDQDNAAALRALSDFLAAEAAKRDEQEQGCDSRGGSSTDAGPSPSLGARALMAAKVRVVPPAELGKRAELPHLLELVSHSRGGKKAKED